MGDFCYLSKGFILDMDVLIGTLSKAFGALVSHAAKAHEKKKEESFNTS